MSLAQRVLNIAADKNALSKQYSGTGRGIVICGGGCYLPSAYVAIRHVRRTGCTLPIELWAVDWTEIPSSVVPHFQKLDVTVRTAAQHAGGYEVLKGYESKVVALVNSAFEEVLLLDADNVVLRDPTPLFDEPDFQQYGQLFWPDQQFAPGQPWTITERAWADFRLPPAVAADLETGQLMVSRRRCWKELQLTEVLNQSSEECYRLYTWGDKDTFVLAWRVLGTPYNVIPHRPTLVFDPRLKRPIRVLWQYDVLRERLFQHQRKHFYAPHEMLSLASPDELFTHESVCYLDDFYQFAPWSGPLELEPFKVPR